MSKLVTDECITSLVENHIGKENISDIGGGTLTGAISELYRNRFPEEAHVLYLRGKNIKDYDSATDVGWYCFDPDAQNPPITDKGEYAVGLTLWFDCNPEYKVQIVFCIFELHIYMRLYGNNKWSSWKEF